MNDKTSDVLIIGGGPAGLTAAIYTSRAGLDTLVIAGSPPGGQLMLTTDVENFPGFPEGIQGPELVTNMRTQAEKFGATFVDENVTEFPGCEHQGFCAKTDNGNQYSGRAVIVATGASAKWLGIESETRLRGKGVSACATCDGFFFKDKTVAVVGGGDSAMEESTFLTKFASKVYVLVRKSKSELKASKIMQERAMNNPKIEFMFNTEVQEVLGADSVTGLKILNNQTGESAELDVQGLFLAIGHVPNTDFIGDFIGLDTHGFAETTRNTSSSRPGVFVAGDVYDTRYRQAITAAGYGCMAAIDVEKYLTEQDEPTKKD